MIAIRFFSTKRIDGAKIAKNQFLKSEIPHKMIPKFDMNKLIDEEDYVNLAHCEVYERMKDPPKMVKLKFGFVAAMPFLLTSDAFVHYGMAPIIGAWMYSLLKNTYNEENYGYYGRIVERDNKEVLKYYDDLIKVLEKNE